MATARFSRARARPTTTTSRYAIDRHVLVSPASSRAHCGPDLSRPLRSPARRRRCRTGTARGARSDPRPHGDSVGHAGSSSGQCVRSRRPWIWPEAWLATISASTACAMPIWMSPARLSASVAQCSQRTDVPHRLSDAGRIARSVHLDRERRRIAFHAHPLRAGLSRDGRAHRPADRLARRQCRRHAADGNARVRPDAREGGGSRRERSRRRWVRPANPSAGGAHEYAGALARGQPADASRTACAQTGRL